MRRARFLALAALLGAASLYVGVRVGSQRTVAVHPVSGRPIAGIATDATWMDRASREQEEAPSHALSLIGIRPGMVVGDIGAGSGYMTLRVAALVGPAGKVYAEDIQPDLLQVLQQKTQAARLSNVEIVLGSDTDAKLPENALDLALLVDVYHEFQHPREMLRSIRGSLKAGGRLVLVEYRKEDASLPIAPRHRLSVADATVEIGMEGFTFDRALEDLPRQHVIVFHK